MKLIEPMVQTGAHWLNKGSDPARRFAMPRPIAADIARSLKQRIEAGEWSDGRQIPPERDLAADFGVARNTIRRAMDLLEEDGVVSRQVGRGTFINPSRANRSLAAIVAEMEGSSPADMMELRLLLEPVASAYAAINATSAQLSGIQEAHRLATSATEIMAFEHWDAELHRRIFACTRNELMRGIHSLVHALRQQSAWYEMKRRAFTEERRQRYCAQHSEIVDAILRRDPEGARAATLAHLKTVAYLG
jgi:DNA-binding FadR family transcriptional regulator